MTYIAYFLVFITNPKKVIKIRTKNRNIFLLSKYKKHNEHRYQCNIFKKINCGCLRIINNI